MRIPPGGFTLQNLCEICKEHGVGIHLGISADNFADSRMIVTIQLSAVKGGQHEMKNAFRCEILKVNPRMNLEVSHLLAQHIEKISNKTGRIHTL